MFTPAQPMVPISRRATGIGPTPGHTAAIGAKISVHVTKRARTIATKDGRKSPAAMSLNIALLTGCGHSGLHTTRSTHTHRHKNITPTSFAELLQVPTRCQSSVRRWEETIGLASRCPQRTALRPVLIAGLGSEQHRMFVAQGDPMPSQDLI